VPDERIWKVGDRVRFYKWPATVVYAARPHKWWPEWCYSIEMDGDPDIGPTKLQRTAITVFGRELQALEEK